ncbi:hypothetical protein SDJN02_15645, partial [Cucurbita argyrosperma subsp. argyrosperma]
MPDYQPNSYGSYHQRSILPLEFAMGMKQGVKEKENSDMKGEIDAKIKCKRRTSQVKNTIQKLNITKSINCFQ